MPAYDLIQKTFEKEFKGVKDEGIDYKKVLREKLIGWRREPDTIVRLENPSNIARARKLGYKAKQGVFTARIRVRKGGGIYTRPNAARRPKRMGIHKLTRHKSIQRIAEERVSKKFPNCEVLNSYFIGQDGDKKYFEVILVDRTHPSVLADKQLSKIVSHRGRSVRGLTSAGKRGRGMHKKGKGTEHMRPSRRSHKAVHNRKNS